MLCRNSIKFGEIGIQQDPLATSHEDLLLNLFGSFRVTFRDLTAAFDMVPPLMPPDSGPGFCIGLLRIETIFTGEICNCAGNLEDAEQLSAPIRG